MIFKTIGKTSRLRRHESADCARRRNHSQMACYWLVHQLMKTKVLIVLGMLLAFFNSQAGVVVYKLKVKTTLTGGLTDSATVSYTGWQVIDSDTGDFVEVYVNAKGKQFFTYASSAAPDKITNSKGQDIDVLVDSFDNGRYTYKGVNSLLWNGATFVNFPKTFQYSGSQVNNHSQSNAALYEESGTLAFDAKTTAAQNAVDGDVDNTANRLTSQLLNQGYTDSD